MLGIDLYKEVLLNGKKYHGKKYKSKDGKIYEVEAYFDGFAHIHNILEQGKKCGVINMNSHDDKCIGIDRFMLTELEEINLEIEMSWQECLVKYIENPDKYYMKAIDEYGVELIVSNKNELRLEYGRPLIINFIKTSKWFLCER